MKKAIKFCVGLFKNIITVNGDIVGRNITQMSFGNNSQSIILDGNSINLEVREINIVVTGDIENVNLGVGKIDIHGSVRNKVSSGPGDITIMGDMIGDVKTGTGKVSVGGDLQGDVKTGTGNVTCKSFDGDFKSGTGKIKTGN